MNYQSTRNKSIQVTSSQAIVNGIAPDGGLYIPSAFPDLDLSLLQGKSYQEMAVEIFKLFLTDFTEDEIKSCVYSAYDHKFPESVVPIVQRDNRYFLELYHGQTQAFKDIALSILPYLMKTAAKRLGIKEELVILTATSGDTGKAALEGFADVEGTQVVVFYPSVGISDIQRLQMMTQEGDNTHVFGIKGNFDDAQKAVKDIFVDKELKEKLLGNGYRFSSANSINIGRLIPQVVYYVYGYLQLVDQGSITLGEAINVVVPTGNFGNILASRYANEIGVPVNKFICASNENDVLTEFLTTGVYDLNRQFKVTNSPSMDILISSNLERLLALNEEPVEVLMAQLKEDKIYTANKDKLKHFFGGSTTEKQTLKEIETIFNKDNYIMDTHTAVASYTLSEYEAKTQDVRPTLIASTASPYKFANHVLQALNDPCGPEPFKQMDILKTKTGASIPEPLTALKGKKRLHDQVIEKEDIQLIIEKVLG